MADDKVMIEALQKSIDGYKERIDKDAFMIEGFQNRIHEFNKQVEVIQQVLKSVVVGPPVIWTPKNHGEIPHPLWDSINFSGLVSGKSLQTEDVLPALEKLKDHLIGKSVTSAVVEELCVRVEEKLKGKQLGDYPSVSSTIKLAMEEVLLSILEPKERQPLQILAEVKAAQKETRPFVISFCGANGAGKSTNLAKICFWLIENEFSVLIAVCDTFPAGAVKQLRTHASHLNYLPPPKSGTPCLQLYEKGYGKDAAGVATEAISFAKDNCIDVVLVDTAGRTRDNEPFMKELAKLSPDLLLFVVEALAGNEASNLEIARINRDMKNLAREFKVTPKMTDGIMLTKVDSAIGDQVGPAVSVAFMTREPIIFVGNGEKYKDLKGWDSRAVVSSLTK